MLKRILIWTALIAGLLITVRAAWAQDATGVTDDDVNRVAKQLFCPVCENVPLDVCPTEACRQWRLTIREKLAEGWTDQQIKDYFVEQYGERVLAEPSTRGLNILLWVLPPLAVAVGGFVLWRVLRGMTPASAGAVAAGGAAPPETDEYVARLEAELKQRR